MKANDLMAQAERANPVPADAFEEWADTSDGRLLLQQILATPVEPSAARPLFRRRAVLLPAGLAVAGSLAAAGYAITHREISPTGTVACTRQFDQNGDMAIIALPEGQSPEGTCLQEMEPSFWNPPPTNLVDCVLDYPDGQGGGLAVFPAPDGMTREEACAALGAALPPEELP